MAVKPESGWLKEDYRAELNKVRNELKCALAQKRVMGKIISTTIMLKADRSKTVITEVEREMIENTRQILMSIFEWM